ncbi:50S ribosomal protein L18 [Candidatus Woesearchaeota archaeon]|nr:50S ribosomal protein L18 [Candidatus Woesearchaeota archaeon]
MKQKTYNVQFRRKREGKTNYKKRLKLLLAGKPRLVIRPSLKNIIVQIIEYHPKGDKVIVAAHSSELDKLGWKFNKGNMPAAYLTGLLAGQKGKDNGVKETILDIGLASPVKGSRIFACLKGVIDGGIKVPVSEEILPKEDRIKGSHITKYAESIKGKENEYSKKFSEYIKLNIDPLQISKIFEEIKKQIIKVE